MKRIVGVVLAASMLLSSVPAYAGGEGSYFKYFKHYKHHHHMKVKVSAPKGPQIGHKNPSVFGMYMASAIGCGTIGLMIGSAGRQLKTEEAEYIVGSCFIPIIGGEIFKYLRQAMAQSAANHVFNRL
ncbi:MAG: hypothetical protein ACXWJW_12450 [Xanthobacteraceae bacterium]